MFEYAVINDSCVFLQGIVPGEDKVIKIPVWLENGIQAEQFVENADQLFGMDDKLIVVDADDIAFMLRDKLTATFGKIRFAKDGQEYRSDDDITWFEEMNASVACFFIEGDITIPRAMKFAEALREALVGEKTCLFSLKDSENSEKDMVAVSILAA